MAKVSRFFILFKFNQKLSSKKAKRKSSNLRIFLYDFGRRSIKNDHSNQFSIFEIDQRRLIDDQQMFYNFKCWLQGTLALLNYSRKFFALLGNNSVNLLNFVHAFEDFNRRFFVKAELEPTEMEIFHREMSRIMDDFFAPSSKSALPIKGNR